MRGALADGAELAVWKGIIPACAGSTCHYQTSASTMRGSSPHVRGARSQYRPSKSRTGIIPACAGSTRGHRGHGARPRDHPRMCGEHPQAHCRATFWLGSSPHVRGAQCSVSQAQLMNGIIPACAGSTERLAVSRCRREGSSPHVRGALTQPSSGLRLARDHPRMCGEHPYHYRNRPRK